MRLEIRPHTNPWYNCLDVLILTLAQHWRCEHRMMFAEAWRFKYEPHRLETGALETGPLEDGSSFPWRDVLDVRELVERRNLEELLRRYHGLSISSHELSSLSAAQSLVAAELAAGYPVALGVDAFFCHWSAAFRKYHLDHYCLAIGMDTDGLLIIDPYLTLEPQRFSFAEYEPTLRDALTFRHAPAATERPDWREVAGAAAERMLGAQPGRPSPLQQMRALARDLGQHLDFHEEVARHVDPFASLLVLYFKTLSFSRLNFAECLVHLESLAREPRLGATAARLKEQGNMLYKIFLLLMKLSLTPERFDRSAIARRLEAVAQEEEEIATSLLQLARREPRAVAHGGAR